MENEVLVQVEGLSKKFCKSLKKSLKYGLYDLMGNLRGKDTSDDLRPDEFWALKDINFEVRRGECLGLIGHNGAGKSTLLKILNGLINPDHGKVTMRGRVGALIELGAGFNPIMTGRENIYNNGAVLGFSREEIDTKVEEIIEFAEIREFIDMPVRSYSSGMKVRLGFAVAAQMEPDVLIIDEVLAVGDLGFVLKCFKQIDEILPNTAIIFVSHSMPMVSRICNQIMLLEKGVSKIQGEFVSQAIDSYYTKFATNGSNIIFEDGSLALIEVEILGVESVDGIPQIKWNKDISVKFKFENISLSQMPTFSLTIFDKEQRPVAVFHPNNLESDILFNTNSVECIVTHEKLQLSKGIYSINISVNIELVREPCLRINGVIDFQVISEIDTWPPFLLDAIYNK